MEKMDIKLNCSHSTSLIFLELKKISVSKTVEKGNLNTSLSINDFTVLGEGVKDFVTA